MSYELAESVVPAGDTPRSADKIFWGLRPRHGSTLPYYQPAANATRGMFLNFFRPAAAGMLRLPQLIISMPQLYYPGFNIGGTGLRRSVFPPSAGGSNGQ